MENHEKNLKLGIVAALTAVRKTLGMYPNGMTAEDVKNMINEIDQQIGLKHTEIELLKRA
jgi:hypothetical protein